MQITGYILFRMAVFVFSILPWSVLYAFSSVLAGFMNHVLRYRRKTVEANLHRVFPDLPSSNIRKIMRSYYQILTEIFIETIKGISLSAEEMKNRFTGDVKIFEQYFREGQDVIMVTSHIGNWEWAALWVGKLLPHHCVGIYKPLSNKPIEVFLFRHRSKYNTELLPVKMSANIWASKVDKPRCIILVADQSPNNMEKAIWVDFFNEKVPFVHGPDDIARMYNLPVIYSLISKVSRGHYHLQSKVLMENPKQSLRGEITQRYADLLAEDIRRHPADWLWSHRRYKKMKI